MPTKTTIIQASVTVAATVFMTSLPRGDAIGTVAPHDSDDGFPPMDDSSYLFMPPKHETFGVYCSYSNGMNGADSWSALEMSYDNYTGVTTVFIACPKIGGRVAFEMVNHRYFLASPGTMDIKQDPFRKLQDPALDEILENLRSATESEFNWRTFGVAEMKAAVDLVGEACSAVVQVIVKRKYPTFKDMCDGFFATISSSA